MGAVAEAMKAAGSAEIWPLIHEQRDKLGDVLETLSDAEWGTLRCARAGVYATWWPTASRRTWSLSGA
jgi:hypothetical protein